MNDELVPVEVVWHDAVASESWTPISEIPRRPAKVRSVGLLYKQSKRAIVLLTSVTHDDHCSFITIPARWVDRVIRLEAVEETQVDGSGYETGRGNRT